MASKPVPKVRRLFRLARASVSKPEDPYFTDTERIPTKLRFGGAEGIRTPDPHNAIVVLYQLSYDPETKKGEVRNCPSPVKGFPTPARLVAET
jgi:hypothetical protein